MAVTVEVGMGVVTEVEKGGGDGGGGEGGGGKVVGLAAATVGE